MQTKIAASRYVIRTITFLDRSALAAAQHSVSVSTVHKAFLLRLMDIGADRQMQSFLAPLYHSLFFSITWGKKGLKKWGLLPYKLSWM